jgi:hypothetical protein
MSEWMDWLKARGNPERTDAKLPRSGRLSLFTGYAKESTPGTYQTPAQRIDSMNWGFRPDLEAGSLRYGYAKESVVGTPAGVLAPVTMNLVEDGLRDSGQVYDRTCLDCLKPLRTHSPIRPVLCVFCVQKRAESIAYLKEDASE